MHTLDTYLLLKAKNEQKAKTVQRQYQRPFDTSCNVEPSVLFPERLNKKVNSSGIGIPKPRKESGQLMIIVISENSLQYVVRSEHQETKTNRLQSANHRCPASGLYNRSVDLKYRESTVPLSRFLTECKY